MSHFDSKYTQSLREPIKLTMQKEIEIIISQYEEEKRQELILDSSIKSLEADLEKHRARKREEEKQELLTKLGVLKRKLEVSQTQCNMTQNENLLLRGKIDHMRIVTTSTRNKVTSLKKDIEKLKLSFKLKNEEQVKEKEQEKEKIEEIRLAMSKSANDKLRYTQKLEMISGIRKQERLGTTQTIRKLNDNLDGILNKQLTVLDNTKILQKLVSRFDSEVKNLNLKVNKKKHQNIKNTEIMEYIKSNSTTYTEADFVQCFLNHYEETTQLSKYLLETLAEIESLEYSNKKIEASIEDSTNYLMTSRNKAMKIYNELNLNMKKTYGAINNSMKHQMVIKDQLDKSRILMLKAERLKKVLGKEKTSSVPDENLNLEEQLADIEDFIYSLKIYKLLTQQDEFSIRQITVTPRANRNLTPEFYIHEIMSSKDLIEEFNVEDEKFPTPIEVMRQRAQIWADRPFSERTKTPPPRMMFNIQ
ncbi:hypothetical protein SteCoe_12438 [Stentor coeruleus]|uniref:Uncharacterized protein n=1 Tax=Stentor coeruleus TaxID=5963 RepID=A0A1R2CAR2_9CILI|nr:hypothetical protein SteCoe_12438 [Stentor coeruleus]